MKCSHSCARVLKQRDKRRLGLGLPSAAGRGLTWRRRGPASALGGKPRPGRPWRRRATSSGCCSNRYGEAGAASASSSSFSSFTAVFPWCLLLSKQNRPQHHRRGPPGTRWSRGGSVWGHWGAEGVSGWAGGCVTARPLLYNTICDFRERSAVGLRGADLSVWPSRGCGLRCTTRPAACARTSPRTRACGSASRPSPPSPRSPSGSVVPPLCPNYLHNGTGGLESGCFTKKQPLNPLSGMYRFLRHDFRSARSCNSVFQTCKKAFKCIRSNFMGHLQQWHTTNYDYFLKLTLTICSCTFVFLYYLSLPNQRQYFKIHGVCFFSRKLCKRPRNVCQVGSRTLDHCKNSSDL